MMRDQIRRTLTDTLALTLTLYGECRGEPVEGQVAVACVIRNRVKASGRTFVAVCLQPSQFSCWWEASPNTAGLYLIAEALMAGATPPMLIAERAAFRQLSWIATGIISGDLGDNTDGARHYLTVALWLGNAPSWAKTATSHVRLGD